MGKETESGSYYSERNQLLYPEVQLRTADLLSERDYYYYTVLETMPIYISVFRSAKRLRMTSSRKEAAESLSTGTVCR